jgi:hypothetical protein
LRRLDDLAALLATRSDAVALLGLGSAGIEHHRMDDHSDCGTPSLVGRRRSGIASDH